MSEAKELVRSAMLRAQIELEGALAELDRMSPFDGGSVAFAAHALNNYLTVAKGTVELLLMRLSDHPDAQLRVWLEALHHATNLMTRTVSQLVNASATPEVPLRFGMVDLATLVQRVCDYYQRVADKKEMRITVGIQDQIPQVWTDGVAVAAVLDNLLSNAVKFSQPGKSIWVHVRQDDGFAACDVLDEGPGLSQQDQGRLFQRGVRLTPQPTDGESSTGFGLAVARELVERLGGRIWCQSSSGKGSCFSFRLPLARETTDGDGRD